MAMHPVMMAAQCTMSVEITPERSSRGFEGNRDCCDGLHGLAGYTKRSLLRNQYEV